MESGSLWRNRDFTLLWTSQTLSDLAAFGTQLALPLLVLGVGGSTAQAGAIATTAAVASTVARLPGGALADRIDRRRLLLISDAIRAAVMALVAVSVATRHVSLPALAASFVVVAIADVVFSPAELAAVSSVVPEEQLPAAFARNEARSHAASLVGPPLGGALFGIARALPFGVDAASYVVSFVAISLIRRPLSPPRDEAAAPASMRTAIAVGLRYVRGSAFLRALLAIAAPINFALSGAIFATTVIWRTHGVAPGTIGAAFGLMSLGGLAGAVLAPWVQRHLGFRALVLTIVWTLAAAVAAAAVLSPHLVMVVPLAVGLFLSPAVNSSLFGRLAATTPGDLQGRVVSVVFFAATGTAALAPLTMGLILSRASGLPALLVCVAALVVAGVAATVSRGIRG